MNKNKKKNNKNKNKKRKRKTNPVSTEVSSKSFSDEKTEDSTESNLRKVDEPDLKCQMYENFFEEIGLDVNDKNFENGLSSLVNFHKGLETLFKKLNCESNNKNTALKENWYKDYEIVEKCGDKTKDKLQKQDKLEDLSELAITRTSCPSIDEDNMKNNDSKLPDDNESEIKRLKEIIKELNQKIRHMEIRAISIPAYNRNYRRRNYNRYPVENLNFQSILEAVGPNFSKNKITSVTINSTYLQNNNQNTQLLNLVTALIDLYGTIKNIQIITDKKSLKFIEYKKSVRMYCNKHNINLNFKEDHFKNLHDRFINVWTRL